MENWFLVADGTTCAPADSDPAANTIEIRGTIDILMRKKQFSTKHVHSGEPAWQASRVQKSTAGWAPRPAVAAGLYLYLQRRVDPLAGLMEEQLPEWQLAGHRLAGRLPARQQLARSPRELWAFQDGLRHTAAACRRSALPQTASCRGGSWAHSA